MFLNFENMKLRKAWKFPFKYSHVWDKTSRSLSFICWIVYNLWLCICEQWWTCAFCLYFYNIISNLCSYDNSYGADYCYAITTSKYVIKSYRIFMIPEERLQRSRKQRHFYNYMLLWIAFFLLIKILVHSVKNHYNSFKSLI